MKEYEYSENIKELLPIWNDLSIPDQQIIERTLFKRLYKKGDMVRDINAECLGMIMVESGLLRAYIISDSGKEITLYHLLDRDACLLSAACVMNNIQFNIMISAAKDTVVYVIPAGTFKKLNERSLPMSNFSNQIMASRFTEVMWLVDQILFKGFDSRLAEFLLTYSQMVGSDELCITHEEIAHHLGTAREVVSRMLKHFQTEGYVSVFRKGIQIEKEKELIQLAESNE